MPRVLLTAKERDARRRERSRRSFSDASYGHYDPTGDGFGSAEQWEAAAERLAAGRGSYRRGAFGARLPDLDVLGLRQMPADIDGLRQAFRERAKATHPDHGGSATAFTAVFGAYERMVRHY